VRPDRACSRRICVSVSFRRRARGLSSSQLAVDFKLLCSHACGSQCIRGVVCYPFVTSLVGPWVKPSEELRCHPLGRSLYAGGEDRRGGGLLSTCTHLALGTLATSPRHDGVCRHSTCPATQASPRTCRRHHAVGLGRGANHWPGHRLPAMSAPISRI